MLGYVLQCPYRKFSVRSIDSYSAAVSVIDCYNIINVRIFGQQFPPYSLNRNIKYSLHALDCGLNTENVTSPSIPAVRIPIAHKRFHMSFGQILPDVHAIGHIVH